MKSSCDGFTSPAWEAYAMKQYVAALDRRRTTISEAISDERLSQDVVGRIFEGQAMAVLAKGGEAIVCRIRRLSAPDDVIGSVKVHPGDLYRCPDISDVSAARAAERATRWVFDAPFNCASVDAVCWMTPTESTPATLRTLLGGGRYIPINFTVGKTHPIKFDGMLAAAKALGWQESTRKWEAGTPGGSKIPFIFAVPPGNFEGEKRTLKSKQTVVGAPADNVLLAEQFVLEFAVSCAADAVIAELDTIAADKWRFDKHTLEFYPPATAAVTSDDDDDEEITRAAQNRRRDVRAAARRRRS